jgi:hypothetical protein
VEEEIVPKQLIPPPHLGSLKTLHPPKKLNWALSSLVLISFVKTDKSWMFARASTFLFPFTVFWLAQNAVIK